MDMVAAPDVGSRRAVAEAITEQTDRPAASIDTSLRHSAPSALIPCLHPRDHRDIGRIDCLLTNSLPRNPSLKQGSFAAPHDRLAQLYVLAAQTEPTPRKELTATTITPLCAPHPKPVPKVRPVAQTVPLLLFDNLIPHPAPFHAPMKRGVPLTAHSSQL